MPTPFNIRKNLAKLLARLVPKKADELFDTTESEIIPSYELRDQASAMMMNVVNANHDDLNVETKFAASHIAYCICFGGWTDAIIRRCADHSEDPIWDKHCQLAIDLILSFKAWIDDDTEVEFENIMKHRESIIRLWQSHNESEDSILESIDWVFVGRLFMGAYSKMYPDCDSE